MAHHAGQHDPAHDPATADKLWALIKDVRICMMTTNDGGMLRSRPMWAQQDAFRGEVYFFTPAASHKTEELAADPRVNLSYADPKGQDYVSISGTARLSDDRGRIGELWTEGMRTWFPEGKDDPQLRLLIVTVEAAEYWDSPSSTMVHLYGYAKAVTTGKPPSPGDNQKVSFQ